MEKSIAELHADLCKRVRADDDMKILYRLRRLCQDEMARKTLLKMLTLKPGDVWYEISTDQEFTMTE